MSSQDINIKRNANKKKNRRKKKRRTANSSSESDISFSSASENELANEETVGVDKFQDIELSEEEEVSEESEQIVDLNEVSKIEVTEGAKTIESVPINTVKVEDKELKNKYLSLIFENFGDDINKLREAPDFKNKTLSLLANVLKEGSEMFDEETLRTILETK
ncbi:hypothetical protein Kpol_529p5 [Vanderwaltozyma polyspora DSM 70294]|uniref:Ribosome assembly protein 3 n=1 Tax=Vanderwaltozyma polyspora (strain ATCC 22028 / DSM 70294 / BCRC 21397 / CBS 2163 / NBRC 10782 / NRRL Y-8283 / UCD 57-17) TaxID=436907 RepID=A7TM58_VANPO|nr:uncharacterized protein Kpol_529p5 [Vanderwaltozyma polyspora DSM 70294]EDO16625.1 hypothetical protein Kpol_529p5 [Vanderwaltozyma polyspora DSM 70294]